MNRKILTGSIVAAFLLALALFQLSGCGGGGGGPAVGTLKVNISDSPAFQDFSSVHINIKEVRVVPNGKDAAPDNDPGLPLIVDFDPGKTGNGRDVDIMKFHFLQEILGSAVIPAGSYNQVRLILEPNPATAPFRNYFILTANPTQQIALTTPSAQQTGVKIVGHFTVTAGVLNTILLDFNPNEAIVKRGQSGQNNLKPTGIRISQIFSPTTNAGSVSGVIRSPSFATWSSATVSVTPRSPAGSAVTAGTVFSNFSSPSVWKAPFTAYVPPNGTIAMPSAFYRVFVDAGAKFQVYSSPLLSVTAGTDTPVTADGNVPLALAP
jgi:Domain of unknown function (DUF4382)